jgi:hypothetical protein
MTTTQERYLAYFKARALAGLNLYTELGMVLDLLEEGRAKEDLKLALNQFMEAGIAARAERDAK